MRVGIDTDFLVRLSIANHPGRPVALELRDRHVDAGDRFALAPQVITEFVHVVTDPRRFSKPLTMAKALDVANAWCEADDVELLIPSAEAMSRFFDLVKKHKLGRKRVLDTALAATLIAAGTKHLITGNPKDYSVFTGLDLIEMK